MQIHYVDKIVGNSTVNKSIFLAGPTPRTHLRAIDGSPAPSWRPSFINELSELGFDGNVFVPETSIGSFCNDYNHQVDWEFNHLKEANAIIFWVPRDLKVLPGFTTNVEFGYWLRDEKMFYGRPNSAPKTKYLDDMYERVLNRKPVDSMRVLADQTLSYLNR